MEVGWIEGMSGLPITRACRRGKKLGRAAKGEERGAERREGG